MLRVKLNWTGSLMGAGVSTFHVDGAGFPETAVEAKNASDNCLALFSGFAAALPSGVTVAADSIVEVIDLSTGDLVDELGITPGTNVVGTSASEYAGGVGARWRWRTNGFKKGRRIVGSTFLVPIVANQFQNNGTLFGTLVTNMLTAGSTLLSAMAADSLALVVWSRPSAPGAGDGAMHAVQSALVPDQVAWLTSRRH